jgi:dihydropteroate synthase
MGIVNVTPDSFSDGGLHGDSASAVEYALTIASLGADIIDVGGESTRPGASPIDQREELRRIIPVIEGIRSSSPVTVSVDTRNAGVADAALRAGADVINDVSALRHDPRMAAVASRHCAPVILMHMLGEPGTMQDNPVYDDVVSDVVSFFKERLTYARSASIENCIIDPGIGFGKRLADNLALLRALPALCALGAPILVGTSRKSFLGKLTGAATADRLPGSIASGVVALMNGASILRVHDVEAMRQAITVTEAILHERGRGGEC